MMPVHMSASREGRLRRRTRRRTLSSASATLRRSRNPLALSASVRTVVNRSSSPAVAGCGFSDAFSNLDANLAANSGLFCERVLRPANQFVQTHRDGLPQIHRNILRRGRNVQQPVAMAQIFIGQSKFLGAKEQRHAIRRRAFARRLLTSRFRAAAGRFARERLADDFRRHLPVAAADGAIRDGPRQ